jgi:tyrosine phenol-lyase
VGGHAVFLDAGEILPHIAPLQYPGIALVNSLYIEGGIRSVELGSVMFGSFDDEGKEIPGPRELVRLAFPRRVYTQSHFDYLVEVLKDVWENRKGLKGYRITYQPKFLRHFMCHFEKM